MTRTPVPGRSFITRLSGLLRDDMVAQMHGLLGGPPIMSLHAVYAICFPRDTKYEAQAMKFQNYGVPDNQVVFIERLQEYGFGVNSLSQIGFSWA